MLKKDKQLLWVVFDLQDLNRVSIRDAAMPSFVETLAEQFSGAGIYTNLDFDVAFDQHKIDPESRNMTTFNTPLRTFRLIVLPMGYTNSPQIMHNDVVFMLQDEIGGCALVYIDDTGIKGPKTRYQAEDGSYEMMPDSDGIR